jgi:hypothetical protein
MPFVAIDLVEEVAKAGITFTFVAVLGGLVGVAWANLRYRRELDLSSLSRSAGNQFSFLGCVPRCGL